jgi:exopolysaccharide biosynthesis polyprenyl glycosylphosphotransferase
MKTPSLSRANALVKRIFDLVVCIPLIVLLLPIMTLIALAIKLNSPGPALFVQTRVGLTGRLFPALKFRSMVVGAESMVALLQDRNEASGPLFKIKDDPRRTLTGRFLRRTSMDELPQLFNVLRGEMSLVGPRPPLPSEVAQYEDWQKQRLAARPGLTGLWQVSGRSNLTFDEQALLDIYYLEHWSLLLDIKILLRTIPIVLFGKGAY